MSQSAPDWIADARELDMDVDMVVRQNLREGILATNLNFYLNFKINCDRGCKIYVCYAQILDENGNREQMN